MKNQDRPTADQPVTNPGTGRRTPRVWGRWLVDRMGFQRQMLTAMQDRPMYYGSAREGDREARTMRRRAKAMAGRRQRVQQAMARRGKR